MLLGLTFTLLFNLFSASTHWIIASSFAKTLIKSFAKYCQSLKSKISQNSQVELGFC